VAPWPGEADFSTVAAPASKRSFEVALAAHAAINKAKAEAEVSMGREVLSLVLAGNADDLAAFEAVRSDVLAGTRVHECATTVDAGLEAGHFAVRDAAFAPRP
jgi:hypothetical protein